MVRFRMAFMFVWPITVVALLNRGPKIDGPWWLWFPTVYAVIGLSYFAGWCFERALDAERW